MTINNAYNPTESKDELTKDQFSYKLEQHYDTIPANNIKSRYECTNQEGGCSSGYKWTSN